MAQKCARCGAHSDIDETFTKVQSLLRRRASFLCPECLARTHRRDLKAIALMLAVFPVLGALSAKYQGEWLLLNVSLLLVFELLAVLPHEYAHALTARALGMRVFRIIIGSGKTVIEGRLGFPLEIKILPFGGVAVVGHTTERSLRLKEFMMALAGPSFNVAVIVIMLLLVPLEVLIRNPYRHFMPFSVLVVANVLVLIGNLIPRRVNTLLGRIDNDGLSLLKAPFLPKAGTEKRLLGRYAMEAVESLRRKDFDMAAQWSKEGLQKFPDSSILRNNLAVALHDMRRHEEAREEFVALLDATGTEPSVRAVVLNNIASADIHLGRPELLGEADRYSAQAFGDIPWHPVVMTTRGTVLVELGRLEEGLGLLREAMAKGEEKRAKASAACYVAIGEHRRGNREEAMGYLEAARKLDPDCQWMEKAEREIGA